ncbi:DNA primase [Anthocerotibacter panamensis]|uniref:DNA primase n=1 Tax=Anthocerotibacter panamensis TaxID=2857077 RepID=UPI001C4015C0|nr:DNA primase [Anthocerotibacter panamensis]
MSTPLLDPRTIDEVRQKADIYDVVAEKVVLRRSGKDFRGMCPFHEGKGLSFSVNPSKNLYKCFACGVGGDTINFVMRLEKIPYVEAVLELARRYNVQIHTSPERRAEYTRKLSREQQLLEILQEATHFYTHSLQSTTGQLARDYLDRRGLTLQTRQKFQLGYAPPGWNTLTTHLVEHKRFPAPLVEAAGLIKAREGGRGWFDYFRHRLIIPITDSRGRVVAFGGRTLGEDQPKYLNSPETELFEKGKILFGLDHAKNSIAKSDCAVVVEGYFDVISLHQAGIPNTVATLGTALAEYQVKQLLRLTPSQQVVLNFDADTAGEKATSRAVAYFKQLGSLGIQPKVLTIPQGKDPDEFIQRHGTDAYLTLVREAPTWRDWVIEGIFRGRDTKRAADFQHCAQAAVELLTEITNSLERTHYLHEIAGRLAAGHGRLNGQIEEELRKRIRSRRWRGPVTKTREDPANKLYTAEFQLLQIFLNIPEYQADITRTLEEEDLEFSFPIHRRIWQLVADLLEECPEHLVPELQRRVAEDSALHDYIHSLLWVSDMNRISLMRPSLVMRAALANMALEICQKRYFHWTRYCEEAFTQGRRDEARHYQEQIHLEHQRIQELQSRCRLTLEQMTNLEETLLPEEEAF